MITTVSKALLYKKIADYNDSVKESKWREAASPEEQQGLKGWPKIMAKAQRLRQEGKVQLQTNQEQYVSGTVQGDNGTYQPQLWRDNPGSQKISAWQCTCPWFDYAFGRTRQWKKLEGRPCAHLLALYWEGLSQPIDSQEAPEQQVTQDTNYQQIPGTLPQNVEEPSGLLDNNYTENLDQAAIQRMTRTIRDALELVQYSGGQESGGN